MRKSLGAAGVVLFAALAAPLAGQAKVIKGPTAELRKKIFLGCWIDHRHMLNVGSADALRKGTQIYFTAKLENAGTYARTVLLPSDIPAHLSVTITGLPLLDMAAGCRAWRFRSPLLAAPR